MRVLLSLIFRLVLLAVFTFGFVVLFEHGPAKFSDGAKTEWNALLFFVGSVLSKQESAQPPATADTAPTPAPTPVSGASLPSKGAQTGEGTNRPVGETPAPNR
jgi:hypothetical protein